MKKDKTYKYNGTWKDGTRNSKGVTGGQGG